MKSLLIFMKGLPVTIVEFFGFQQSAFGGIVVEGAAQCVLAKVFPVRFCVAKVQVPGLVNGVGGGHGGGGGAAEEDEFFILLNYTAGIKDIPAIFLCQPVREPEIGAGIVGIKKGDPFP